MNAKIKITGAETRLERAVQKWPNARGADYENGAEGALKNLAYGGCESGVVGVVGELIYYEDTLKFFATHRREISALLAEFCDDIGQQPSDLFGDKWDKSDPLAQETQNRNLIAWFGFEETAKRLANRNEIEI